MWEEIEINKALRGCYYNGIMKVGLEFQLPDSLDSLSKKDFGTFVHEYVHFLQNLTTPWGLYSSMNRYSQIDEVISQAMQNPDEALKLPISIDYSSRSNQILLLGNGKMQTEDGIYVKGLKIDSSKEIILHRKVAKKEGNFKFEYIIFDVPFERIGYREYHFGAWAIIESMAVIIQDMVDPGSLVNHDAIPYKLVSIYCGQKYPQLNDHPEKILIALYASLFSLRPGVEFLNNIDKIAKDPNITAKEWVVNHLSAIRIKINGTYEVNVSDFYKDISARFLTTLQRLVQTKPYYIASILQATQIEHGRLPIIELIGETITPESLNDFMEKTGMPIFLGSENTCKAPIVQSGELQMLYALEMLSTYLSNPAIGCPNKPICNNDEKYDTSICFDTPWKNNPGCPMSAIAYLIGIDKKDTQIIYS